MANLRKFYKWTNKYIKIKSLAKKRGGTWAKKHKILYLWLRKHVMAFDEQTMLDSLDRRKP